jgi:hypothetical protein
MAAPTSKELANWTKRRRHEDGKTCTTAAMCKRSMPISGSGRIAFENLTSTDDLRAKEMPRFHYGNLCCAPAVTVAGLGDNVIMLLRFRIYMSTLVSLQCGLLLQNACHNLQSDHARRMLKKWPRFPTEAASRNRTVSPSPAPQYILLARVLARSALLLSKLPRQYASRMKRGRTLKACKTTEPLPSKGPVRHHGFCSQSVYVDL